MKVVGIYAVLLAFGIGCVHKSKRVVDRYDDGRVFAVCIYPNIADTATFELLNYHHNGKLFKKGEIKNGQYIGEKIIYFDNGKIYQVRMEWSIISIL
jgi:antitoxin component YwqK of YwqJK toxin-antitoxin module